MFELRQDMHVHSTFSDGANSLEENVAEAERLSLLELGCVDHVRVDTAWLHAYVAAVVALREHTRVRLQCGIEAKLLDTAGALDLPERCPGVDAIYAADHQVPLADGPHHPREIRAALADGSVSEEEIIGAVVASTAAAVQSHEGVVIAHFFSILPKVGIDESRVALEPLEELARATAASGARIEISERWRCPSARTLRPFVEHGVPILISTDSHRRETIGRYQHCTGVLATLAGG
jgi:putative hydrolase